MSLANIYNLNVTGSINGHTKYIENFSYLYNKLNKNPQLFLSEKNTKYYSFKELLTWVKLNIPKDIKHVCVMKNSVLNNIQLHIYYLDKDKKPLLDENIPSILINTNSLDEKLIQSFGGKNMLILG